MIHVDVNKLAVSAGGGWRLSRPDPRCRRQPHRKTKIASDFTSHNAKSTHTSRLSYSEIHKPREGRDLRSVLATAHLAWSPATHPGAPALLTDTRSSYRPVTTWLGLQRLATQRRFTQPGWPLDQRNADVQTATLLPMGLTPERGTINNALQKPRPADSCPLQHSTPTPPSAADHPSPLQPETTCQVTTSSPRRSTEPPRLSTVSGRYITFARSTGNGRVLPAVSTE